jgi:hypothetical protein
VLRERVEQGATRRVGKGAEDVIHAVDNRKPNGFLSTLPVSGAWR